VSGVAKNDMVTKDLRELGICIEDALDEIT